MSALNVTIGSGKIHDTLSALILIPQSLEGSSFECVCQENVTKMTVTNIGQFIGYMQRFSSQVQVAN